jgi:two-component system sensor histidine kinase DegS
MKTARLARGTAAGGGLAGAVEEERRRLARELHDGPAQTMAAALFGVDLAVAALDRTPATARDELIAARALLRDALEDVRALMGGLRPRLLEEHGLAVALERLAENPPLWGPRVRVEISGEGAHGRLPASVELGLFRIAQEAVSNARRHGAAAHVLVHLKVAPAGASLLVVDDGRGFEPARVMPGPGRGEGLPGMRERAAQLGGELTIASARGAGTRVAVWLPLAGVETELGEGAA